MKDRILRALTILKEKRKCLVYYTLACIVPALLWFIVFAKPHITQGGYTPLTSDLNGQYVSFLMYFRNAILHGDSLLFTFSGLLGTDTASMIGYYLMSPLNLLVLAFPADRIARAIFWIISLKVVLAGFTASVFFGKKRGYDLKCLIFSTTYALSGYVFAYFMHIMWLDSIYMLPLIALGIEKLVKDGKKPFYIITLAYTFITCYYTGYMAAGFSLLYFFYLLFTEEKKLKSGFIKGISFFSSSIIAALISAAVLVPALLSQYGSRGENLPQEPIVRTAAQMISRLFTGAYSAKEFSEGAPHIYSGMLVLFLVILFFMPQKEKRNKRTIFATAVLVSLFILSFSIDQLDIVWHIFAQPHSFLHRYAFVFVFVMILIAERTFSEEIKKVSIAGIIFADLIVAGMYAAVLIMKVKAVNEILLHLDLLSVIVISLLMFFFITKENKNRNYAFAVIAAIQLIMIAVNGFVYVSVYQFDDHSAEGYYDFVKPMIDRVNEYDSGFYRIEKSFFNTNNDAMMMSYNGFSHFSSADKYFVRNFMADLGYNRNYFWIYYDKGATIAGDSLLGMKYFLSKDPYDNFKVVDTVNDMKIYENPYALPLGFLSDPGISSLKLDHEAPFTNQQMIYNALLGEEEDFFHTYDNYSMDISKNLTWTVQDDGSNMFVRESEDEEGIITICFTAEDSNPAFLFLSSVYEPNVIVLVNGVNLGSYLSTYHQGVLPIGSFKPGSEVEIKVSLVKLHAGFENPQIASIDMDKFAAVSQRLQQGGWNVLEHNSMYIKAEVSAESDKLVFTSIPYFDGWKVYVDGAETKTSKVCDTLLAFPVQKGDHLIEMKYEAAGVIPGILLSVFGVALLVTIILWEKGSIRPRKKPKSIEDS